MPTQPSPGHTARSGASRPLRRDAEANRLRILDAAGAILAERGLEVSMEDIATAAGVGVGTLYRRFPDKQQLIDALFGQRVARVAEVARESLTTEDPWTGVETFMRRAITMQLADRALAELLRGQPGGGNQVERARAMIDPLVDHLVERSQASGQLRPDITGSDLAAIGMMTCLFAERLHPINPRVWERYFNLLLDGLRTERAVPTPLGPEPIDHETFYHLASQASNP